MYRLQVRRPPARVKQAGSPDSRWSAAARSNGDACKTATLPLASIVRRGIRDVTERTLVLVKPDGVQRLLVGRIIARYEERGLKIVGLKLVHVDRELAERHYAVHKGKPFFEGLVSFITSGPLVAMALEGPDAIAYVRTMNGATRPTEASPGTIRGDFAVEMGQNLVHASDSPESAATELAIWFQPTELLSYERAVDRWVMGPGA
jgi:nucleoside-diphosphate kinase